MGFGTTAGNGNQGNSTFLHVRMNAAKGADNCGFMHETRATGEDGKVIKNRTFHDSVDGVLVNVKLKQEKVFEAKSDDDVEWVIYAQLKDAATNDKVVVVDKLEQSSGRRLIGLLAAAAEHNGVVTLRVSHAAAGTQFGSQEPLKTDRAYMNAYACGMGNFNKDARLDALYYDAEGQVMIKDGKPAPLAMGEKVEVLVGRKKEERWVFDAANEMALDTARVLMLRFQKPAQNDTDSESDGVDLSQAHAPA